MTAEETAKSLVEKFKPFVDNGEDSDSVFELERAKQCSVICCDEILNNFGLPSDGKQFYTAYATIEFWQSVRSHIQKIGG